MIIRKHRTKSFAKNTVIIVLLLGQVTAHAHQQQLTAEQGRGKVSLSEVIGAMFTQPL